MTDYWLLITDYWLLITGHSLSTQMGKLRGAPWFLNSLRPARAGDFRKPEDKKKSLHGGGGGARMSHLAYHWAKIGEEES